VFSPIDRRILNIAVPMIVANITVPLLGLVDVTITGHLGSKLYIGAIAIGSMVFNVIYWVLGFLRMGTSGLTAQAFGKGDAEATAASLWRSLLIGELMAWLIVAFQKPIFSIAMILMSPPEGVGEFVRTYFDICVWGAPAMIGLYSLTGWLIGLQDTRVPMAVAIVQNVVNIAVSVLLVYCFGWNIDGVATGTLVAVWAGFAMAAGCIATKHRRMLVRLSWHKVFDWAALKRFANVNSFIFLRTLCLVGVNLYFVVCGSRQGALILAVNTLLMQLFTIFSYIMDGFAYSAEALCGYAVGKAASGNNKGWKLADVVRHEFVWGLLVAALFTIVYASAGRDFLALLTDQRDVVEASYPYFAYAVLIPAVGMVAFVLDGVFIGLTASRGMLASCAIAAIVFAATVCFLSPIIGNHALWIAYLAFLLMRGIVEMLIFCRELRGS